MCSTNPCWDEELHGGSHSPFQAFQPGIPGIVHYFLDSGWFHLEISRKGTCWCHLHSHWGSKGRIRSLLGVWWFIQTLQMQNQGIMLSKLVKNSPTTSLKGAWFPPPGPDGSHRQEPHAGRYCCNYWNPWCCIWRSWQINHEELKI